jgi:uncharacterized repeat protein (TIGR02543 family)
VEVRFSERGGKSGTIAVGETVTTSDDTTVTLSTNTNNATIYYTKDGSAIEDLGKVESVQRSSTSFIVEIADPAPGNLTHSLEVHALAIGPGMRPSPEVSAGVTVDYTTYTVTYHPNGADGGTVPEDTEAYEAGDKVTVKDQRDLDRSGYTFAGWNTEPDASGSQYAPGETFEMGPAAADLYAQWNPAIGISVDFENPEDPTITFEGASSQVNRGTTMVVSVEQSFGSYTWFVDGSTDSAALSPNGSGATVDTGELSYGTHTLSVVTGEGYSAQFSFDVVSN